MAESLRRWRRGRRSTVRGDDERGEVEDVGEDVGVGAELERLTEALREREEGLMREKMLESLCSERRWRVVDDAEDVYRGVVGDDDEVEDVGELGV
ncbi:hypothetical protein MMC06_000868 [Schaereria dolodes]|nr:hypothetical protein [Schaereria dolodes]